MRRFATALMTGLATKTLALSALVIGVWMGPNQPAQSEQNLEARLQGGVVQIFSYSRKNGKVSLGSGTGFVVNKQGWIATNNHVIDGAEVLYVNPEGSTFNLKDGARGGNAELMWRSDSSDLAILKLTGSQLPAFTPMVFSKLTPNRGEEVMAIGYPGAADQHEFKSIDATSNATFTKGVLSREQMGSWDRGGVPIPIVQHSAQVSWGNSGGPLLDTCGRVIGVNTTVSLGGRAFLRVGDGKTVEAETQAPGVYFASNISVLLDQLSRMNVSYGLSSEVCRVFEDVLSDNQKNFQNILMIVVVIGVIGFAGLGFAIFRLQKGGATANAAPAPAPNPAPSPASAPQTIRRTSSQAGDIRAAYLTGKDFETGGQISVEVRVEDFQAGKQLLGRHGGDPRLVINGNGVSREHAGIFWRGDVLMLEDRGSTNGTKINGRRLTPREPVQINTGDVVQFGPNVELQVRIG